MITCLTFFQSSLKLSSIFFFFYSDAKRLRHPLKSVKTTVWGKSQSPAGESPGSYRVHSGLSHKLWASVHLRDVGLTTPSLQDPPGFVSQPPFPHSLGEHPYGLRPSSDCRHGNPASPELLSCHSHHATQEFFWVRKKRGCEVRSPGFPSEMAKTLVMVGVVGGR